MFLLSIANRDDLEHIIAATDIEDDFWVGDYRSETPGGKIILSDGRRKIREPQSSGGQSQSSGGQPQNSGGQLQSSGGQPQSSGGQPQSSGGQGLNPGQLQQGQLIITLQRSLKTVLQYY